MAISIYGCQALFDLEISIKHSSLSKASHQYLGVFGRCGWTTGNGEPLLCVAEGLSP